MIVFSRVRAVYGTTGRCAGLLDGRARVRSGGVWDYGYDAGTIGGL